MLSDEPALGGLADRVVGLIEVSGGARLRTPEGVGPGSTIGDAKRAWGDLLVIGCPAGVTYVYVPRRPGLGLRFGGSCSAGEGEVGRYPDSLTIRAVDIFTPIEIKN